MNNNQLLLKIKIGKNGEMRRATINTPKSFAEFEGFLSGFFESSRPDFGKFKIVYEDDEGDQISIYNDADLQEALRQALTNDKPILRITVTRILSKEEKDKRAKDKSPSTPTHNNNNNNSNEERRCPRFRHFASGNPLGPLAELLQTAQARLPDLLNNPALRAMAEGLIGTHALKVVTNYVCDHCNGQISGDRYHSSTNDNFDLCSACYAAVGDRLNAEHKFNKVSALEALIQCLQGGGTFDAFFCRGPAQPDVPAQHHAICDVCDSPIVGSRFKCLDCADYDECSICRKTSQHGDGAHVFHEITDVSVRAVPEEVRSAHDAKRADERKAAQQEAAVKAAALMERLRAEEEAKRAEETKRVEEAKRAEEAAAKAKADADAAARARADAEAAKFVPLEPPKSAEPAEQKNVSSFEANLNTLESMGFCDRRRNIQVLVRNRNNLFAAIQEILGGQ